MFNWISKALGDDKPSKTDRTSSTDKNTTGKKPASKKASQPATQKRDSRSNKKDHKKVKPNENATQQKPTEIVDNWNPDSFVVPEDPEKVRFHDLDLPDCLMHAIADMGFQYCTPIQSKTLIHTLDGKDLSGKAQTGTGKTAAFLISTLTDMVDFPIEGKRRRGQPRALVVAPTRELVMQIAKDADGLSKYTGLNVLTVVGGMDYERQRQSLRNNVVDLLVATPGRLLDFNRKGDVDLSRVETLVLDEADRMLSMGFIPDVREIIRSTPHKRDRQTLLFSATFTDDILNLARMWTHDAVRVEIEPEKVTSQNVEQTVYLVSEEDKFNLLYNMVSQQELERVMVFANRRDVTRRITERLKKTGISAELLSGEVAQNKRVKTLEAFRSGRVKVLVATDVAGRGIHIDDVSHVINYNLPEDPEDYVHRIGRTGRAGAKGISYSFACESDAFMLPDIEEMIEQRLECTQPEEHLLQRPQ